MTLPPVDRSNVGSPTSSQLGMLKLIAAGAMIPLGTDLSGLRNRGWVHDGPSGPALTPLGRTWVHDSEGMHRERSAGSFQAR